MTNVDHIAADLLNLNVKEAIQLKTNLERTLGLQMLPTLDIRLVPGTRKPCGGASEELVIIIVHKVGDHADMFRDIAVNCFQESRRHIDELVAAGNGIFENKKRKEEAEILKPALESVGAEIELK